MSNANGIAKAAANDSPSFFQVFFGRCQAINDSALSGPQKDTARVLLFYSRDNDTCYPGTARLARDLSVDGRTVRRRLRELESLGVIQREPGQNQRLIRLQWDRLPPGESLPNSGSEVQVAETKPERNCPGGRTNLSGGEDKFARQTRAVRSPEYRREEDNEESIEKSRAPRTNSSKTKTSRFDALTIELPEAIDTPEIRAAWADWIATRREARKPLTPTSARLAIDKLTRAGPAAALEALQASAANGWQGIFPERSSNGTNSKGGNKYGRGLQGAVYDPSKPVAWF